MKKTFSKDQFAAVLGAVGKAFETQKFTTICAIADQQREVILAALEFAVEREAFLDDVARVIEPFAGFAETAENFVAARAKDNGSPLLPTKNFRLSHFEAARDLYSKLKERK